MIQASSLSDIQAVADSPPLKPSFKRSGGDPLVLYIARVPGSPDIFLTTLKPHEKTVTVHDVSSSIYYCHLETAQDRLLKPHDEDQFENEITGIPDLSIQSPVDQSSLENSLNSLTSEAGTAPAPPPRLPPLSHMVKRKPVESSGSHAGDLPDFSAPLEAPPQPPRPMGPRPMNGNSSNGSSQPDRGRELEVATDFDLAPPLPRRPFSTDSPTQQTFFDPASANLDLTRRPYMKDFEARPHTARASVPRSPHSFDATGVRRSSASRPPLSPSSTMSSLTRTSSVGSAHMANTQDSILKGFNVTVIRRDPSTGRQSNIGKITIPPLTSRYARPGKALLQLFNPGYEKFRAARGTSTADLVRCISEDDKCTYSCDLRLATRRRSLRSPSAPYFGDVPVNQLIAVTPSQPYSFVSPWNRVCEFSTALSGRSLKCRHMLARGTLRDENMNEMTVVGLSELRFNTPSNSLFAKASQARRSRRPTNDQSASSSSAADTAAMAAAAASFTNSGPAPPLPPRNPLLKPAAAPAMVNAARQSYDSSGGNTFDSSRQNSSSAPSIVDGGGNDDGESSAGVEPPMDLGLGQERAGGGMRGNKTKLGKLVVEPEGIEMLDLLVVANMGVWWSIR